jgi:exodeoxyribonuclease VII large subunit
VYLTLKDEQAQIRAVLWRGTASRLPFELADGLEVVAFGSVEVYAPRGSYQLVIRHLQPKGVGALELAFRQLKEKLEKEGLFDPIHKKPLPRYPRRIVVVTSPTGAAVRDFLQVTSRRWTGTEIWICPVRVQGDGAAAEIAAALGRVNRIADVDLIVLTRGGGSLEDLWAFNEEAVARAIFHSKVPVVSAVGHEIDLTIADLVADRRALTPSEAGELVVPNREEVVAWLQRTTYRLRAGLRGRTAGARALLEALGRHRVFQKPLERVRDGVRRLDEWDRRAGRAVAHRVKLARSRVERLAHALESLSPLAVLARGYSVTLADGKVVRRADEVTVGQALHTRVHQGQIRSRVEEAKLDQG